MCTWLARTPRAGSSSVVQVADYFFGVHSGDTSHKNIRLSSTERHSLRKRNINQSKMATLVYLKIKLLCLLYLAQLQIDTNALKTSEARDSSEIVCWS